MHNQQDQNVGNAAFREFCRMSPPEFAGECVPSKAGYYVVDATGTSGIIPAMTRGIQDSSKTNIKRCAN
ncbi:hypothetical protein A2U01_0019062 [Trifolium medium]|uniref:Uncharacterized protein n=1 Tax=Trifolium medium TaxID=97028 RepID=A0A392NFE0_9FABA|nr:hypothetical protein [Trifolium medium]